MTPKSNLGIFIIFVSVKHMQKNIVFTFFIPISHLHYTFSYALYMITGVQELAEHLHSTDENQATKVTPIAHCI